MQNTNLDLNEINGCIRCGTCRAYCPVFEESGLGGVRVRRPPQTPGDES